MALTIPASIANVTDLAALSAALGPATQEEVRALVPASTDAALVQRGAGVATPRVDDDALRLIRDAAYFFVVAAPAARKRVNLSPEFLRVVAWSALQGHEAWSAFATRTAQSGTKDATRVVRAVESLKQSRAWRDQLAEVITQVGGTSAWKVKVADAVHPAAAGMPEARADVAVTSLVAHGRALLASKRADVRKRAALYALTAEQLAEAEKVAAETAGIVGKAKAPKSRVKRSDVDLWDGLNLAILERVRRAFATAHALDPAVPTLGFVSLRAQAGTKGKDDPGGDPASAGGDPASAGGGAQTAGGKTKTPPLTT